MKAVRFHETGPADVLKYEDVSQPSIGADDILVRTVASGVNFIDTYQRSGAYPVTLPFIAGQEAAGEIVEVGNGIDDLSPGDRIVFDQMGGGYAELAAVSRRRAIKLPDGIGFDVAAAVCLQGMTAHFLTHSCYPLNSGDTCLIHAAAGGVGLLLIQMAKKRGARVIGTVSNEEKAVLARNAGADEIIIYTQEEFAPKVREMTDGKGVQVVYDSVGKDTFDGSISALAPRGYLVLFGQSSGRVAPVDPQTLNANGSLFLTRPTLANYRDFPDEVGWRSGDLFRWILQGDLSVRIGAQFPLAEAAEAHRQLENRQTTGKVLLFPQN